MNDIEKETLSKQQLKSRETKRRIFRAAKTILQKKGYEQLSIKNICEEAGVSNGSFYHHFKTKDDLLSYYLEEQPGINPDLLDLPEDAEEAKIAIIHVYLHPDTLMLAVESRTSSPVRIPRGGSLESVEIAGLYPCGEGAGYAGGITSAAMDGVKVAEAIRRKYTAFDKNGAGLRKI